MRRSKQINLILLFIKIRLANLISDQIEEEIKSEEVLHCGNLINISNNQEIHDTKTKTIDKHDNYTHKNDRIIRKINTIASSKSHSHNNLLMEKKSKLSNASNMIHISTHHPNTNVKTNDSPKKLINKHDNLHK